MNALSESPEVLNSPVKSTSPEFGSKPVLPPPLTAVAIFVKSPPVKLNFPSRDSLGVAAARIHRSPGAPNT